MTKKLTRPHKKAGRKSLYTDEDRICALVMRMGKQGYSKHEMSLILDVALPTMARWEQEHPLFRGAMSRARALSQGWWERQGRANINNPMFNSNLFRLNMKARFGGEWADRELHDLRSTVVHVFDKPMSREEWIETYVNQEALPARKNLP